MINSSSKLGLIVRGDRTGLGIQTHDYYKFLQPDKVLGVYMPDRETDFTLYPDIHWAAGMPTVDECEQFLSGLDVVFTAESPYRPDLFAIARRMGVRSVLHYNYELLQQVSELQAPSPDVFLAPSLWHASDVINISQQVGSQWQYLAVGVDRDKFRYRQRTRAKTFLHIAGRQTLLERNGTDIFMKAIPLVQSKKVRFIVRTQYDLPWQVGDDRLRIMGESEDNNLYDAADVLVMPRKYGGLCLPLNEAMSCGVVPLMTDCEPQSISLPRECLLSASTGEVIMTKGPIQTYDVSPQLLAQRIDELATEDISELSKLMNKLAENISWKTLLPAYRELLR